MTLANAALGRPTLAKNVALVLGGTLLIAVAAKVTVPFWPVPLSMQTLAVLLVGAGLGARLGAAAVLVYLAEGTMGLPVFTPTTVPGVAAFAGPTGGFLVGFVPMAFLAGLATERLGGRVPALIGAMLTISAGLYVIGLAWPLGVASAMGVTAGWANLSFGQVAAGFLLPFLLGDALKSVVAALIVAGGFRALSR